MFLSSNEFHNRISIASVIFYWKTCLQAIKYAMVWSCKFAKFNEMLIGCSIKFKWHSVKIESEVKDCAVRRPIIKKPQH